MRPAIGWRHVIVRLSVWLRRTLYVAVGVLFLTGTAWFVGNRFTEFSRSETWQRTSTYLMMVHGGAAMAFLFAFGALGAAHIPVAWRSDKNRRSGIVILAASAVLSVTAFGLYYVGSETLRHWTSDLHLAIGLGFPILLVLHIAVGRYIVSARKSRLLRKRGVRHRRHARLAVRDGDHARRGRTEAVPRRQDDVNTDDATAHR